MSARRYDTRTTIFSPEGRLFQVEYAMEAINCAGCCVGIVFDEGIILAAELKSTSNLLDQESGAHAADIVKAEKLYKIDDHIGCSVAGITADANILTQNAQIYAQQYLKTYNEPMPVEQLVQRLCDLKQGYTQHGGLRPFGVSFLFAGYDKHHGFQLYQSDPSGNYSGWRATSIGSSHQAAQNILKEEYAVGMTREAGLELIVKVFLKTMDSAVVDAKRLEFGVLSKDSRGRPFFRTVSEGDVQSVIDAMKLKLEEEKKKEQQQEK